MAKANDKSGWYNIEFVKPLDSQYKCLICSYPLRSPFQTECGHRFCEGCIKTKVTDDPKVCPIDNHPLSIETIFRDAFCNREILEMACYCAGKPLGCKWIGQCKKLEEHYAQCMCFPLDCPNEGCDTKVQRQFSQHHVTKECRFKKTPCPYCHVEIPEQMMETHHNTDCAKLRLPCRIQCGETIAREDMEHHVANDCPKVETSCPYDEFGCTYKGSRAELKKHLEEKSLEHAYTLKNKHGRLQIQVNELKSKIESQEAQQQQLSNRLSNQTEVVAFVRDNVATLRSLCDQHANKLTELAQKSREPSSHRKRESKEAEKTSADVSELNDFKRCLEEIEDQVTKLQVRERQALGRGQIGTQAATVGDEGTAALERRVAAVEHQQTLSNVQMAEHDAMISMLETTSYDGNYIWKIEDLGRRIHEAVTGGTPFIDSPPFYVSHFGYKVCARVYLNGVGMGRNTHLSLFFVVMRGDYDGLLPWPFQQKVTFKLIDQTRGQHIIDSFFPDPNNSCFQRPTGIMNKANGRPLFVPKSDLHSRGYIREETIYLQISVDTTGIPCF